MKAVIFDLDGVLVDSMWIWKDLAYNYLKSLGCEPEEKLRDDLLELSLYEGYEYLIEKYNLNKSFEEIKDELKTHLLFYYRNEVNLKPGVMDCLDYLKNNKYILSIGTASESPLVREIIKKYNIYDYFKIIETEVDYKKDDRNFYINICNKLGVKVENTYLIDDSSYAIKTAASAGLKTIGFYDEISSEIRGDLKGVGDYYIQDLEEIKEIL